MTRTEHDLPWYTALLGNIPEGEKFNRFLTDFNLLSEESKEASNRWYENAELGVSLFVYRGKVDAIQFYSAEHPDFDEFQGQLPLDLDFKMTRDKVHEKLGNADHVTTARYIDASLNHSGIDRYYTKTCNVAVTYSTVSGCIEVLSFEAHRLD